MAGHEQFEELAAGHALHALEPSDEQIFLSHLDDCAECQRSLAEFSELAAGLAVSSAEAPPQALPPELWDSIRSQVQPDHEVVVPFRSRTPRMPPRRAWLTAAAAVTLVVAGLVGWQVAKSGSSSRSTVQSAIADCRASSGCRVVPLSGVANSRDLAYLLIRGRDVRVATSSLPAIDAARETYVLWQMPPGGRPAGVVAFSVANGHAATVAHGTLPLPYADTTTFAISREAGTTIPAGPSASVATGAATST